MNLPKELSCEYSKERYFLEAAKILDSDPALAQWIKAKVFADKLNFLWSHPLRDEFDFHSEFWYFKDTSHETRILFLLFLDTIIQSGDSLQ